MTPPSISPVGLDKLRARIRALRSKTLENGCTEDEALSAAAKVAELLDRDDLSLTDIEIREEPYERLEFRASQKKRIPLEGCVGAVGAFCDCRAWREKTTSGEFRYVFFGLRGDVSAALYLAELVDASVRAELGRYKTSPEYLRFKHNERHLANASFALGMVDSIASKLLTMKAARDESNRISGRGLVVLKASIVEAELTRLGVQLRPIDGTSRVVSTTAYEAGATAGDSLAIKAEPDIGR
jgi:hypothetical protein